MEKYLQSQDGIRIHYEISEAKPTALVFVHGWLGNGDWWKSQRDFFQDKYNVVQVDLPGHGKSGTGRIHWSSAQYAKDIKDVVDQIPSDHVVLIGHSMSGPYTLEASLIIPRVKLVVLVDTLKNMDQLMDIRQAEELLFKSYRKDFNDAVENLLPRFLFAKSTPVAVREQLQREFLQHDAAFAVKSLEPLYAMDIRSMAKLVHVPVRAINSDLTPTNIESIRKYLSDFSFVTISGSGHYPMLEKPDEFNFTLDRILRETLS
ncbi:MAG TPA: alpha/beta hydrolase [Chitinophagaceae bacterium]|nr:alpha/beta hydrolase [Chitinophagaceae bacterium]